MVIGTENLNIQRNTKDIHMGKTMESQVKEKALKNTNLSTL